MSLSLDSCFGMAGYTKLSWKKMQLELYETLGASRFLLMAKHRKSVAIRAQPAPVEFKPQALSGCIAKLAQSATSRQLP